MPSVCLYFQVHQPYRLRNYHIFDIGQSHHYFDEPLNRDVCRKVAEKCYLPANQLLLDLLNRHPEFKLSFSISGVALEQFADYAPAVIESFKKLVDTGRVELLAETYYHSFAALFNPAEFKEQVTAHKKLVKRLFGVSPQVFRNTELVYSDAIAELAERMGFKAILSEGADRILQHQSPNFLYEPATASRDTKLLLKNYKLSDDIAFRFSNRQWPEWPLTSEKFASWLHQIDGSGDIINLFMDYETIGEHQWAETGIFDFFKALPEAILHHPSFNFATPSEIIDRYEARNRIAVPQPISWADTERDLSAWMGNPMQDAATQWLYSLESAVKATKDASLLHTWRKLQTSDHFYYMCTKHANDGSVHQYFSIHENPHDSYMILNNVLTDLELRLKNIKPKKTAVSTSKKVGAKKTRMRAKAA